MIENERPSQKLHKNMRKMYNKLFMRIRSCTFAISTLNVILIIVLASTFFFSISFFPIIAVDVTESYFVPHQTGINTLTFNLNVSVANVNLVFEDLDEKLLVLNVSIYGKVGFMATNLFDIAFNYTTIDNMLTVNSKFDTSGLWPWYEPGWLKATCNVFIDPSLNASVDVKTNSGQILLHSQTDAVISFLSLESLKDEIRVNLTRDTTIAGNIFISTTAGIEFLWDDITLTNNVLVHLKGGMRELEDPPFLPGEVNASLKQEKALEGNVTFKAETPIGQINFAMDVRGNVGVEIESVSLSGIDMITIDHLVGFSDWSRSTKSPLNSNNYPASSNFNVVLKTNTGNIHISSEYNP